MVSKKDPDTFCTDIKNDVYSEYARAAPPTHNHHEHHEHHTIEREHSLPGTWYPPSWRLCLLWTLPIIHMIGNMSRKIPHRYHAVVRWHPPPHRRPDWHPIMLLCPRYSNERNSTNDRLSHYHHHCLLVRIRIMMITAITAITTTAIMMTRYRFGSTT